jgi:hypothetical protein
VYIHIILFGNFFAKMFGSNNGNILVGITVASLNNCLLKKYFLPKNSEK